MVRRKGVSQIGPAIEKALQHRPVIIARRRHRQVAAERDGFEHAGKRPFQPNVRQNQNIRQTHVAVGKRIEKIVEGFGGAFGVDQRRAERPEWIGPDANDGGTDGKARLFHGKGHQEAHAASGAILVANEGEAHGLVLDARHGGREKPSGEEDIRLHDAVGQKVEFFLHVITELTRIDAEFPAIAAHASAAVGHGAVTLRGRHQCRDARVLKIRILWIAGHAYRYTAFPVF